MAVYYYKSPIGILEIIIKYNAITSLKLVENGKDSDKETILSNKIKVQLDEYFSRRRKNFDVKIRPEGSEFQKTVWGELQKIPYGKTKNYSEIAKIINHEKSQRAVGAACGKNPIMLIIPCHRIITKDGKLGGFAYGSSAKKILLELECAIKDDTKNICESFPPSVNINSKVLILGSMPGVTSLKEKQYYAHPQNRFWKVMSAICNEPKLYEFDYDLKLKTLLKNNIALWDTIKSCKRKGSLDSDIQNEIPNDIRWLLKHYPNIKTICLNGNKSYLTFKKHFPDLLREYNCIKTPSTSPANAKCSLKKLVLEWENAIKPIKKAGRM